MIVRLRTEGGTRWGLWAVLERDGLRREERERGPASVLGDRKRPTLDRLYCRYSYPLGHQTNSECGETWQAAYLQHNNTARQLSSHSENIFRPLIKHYFG